MLAKRARGLKTRQRVAAIDKRTQLAHDGHHPLGPYTMGAKVREMDHETELRIWHVNTPALERLTKHFEIHRPRLTRHLHAKLPLRERMRFPFLGRDWRIQD